MRTTKTKVYWKAEPDQYQTIKETQSKRHLTTKHENTLSSTGTVLPSI